MLIESPYFVLGDANIERVRQLTARGVKVRVLTNSAASHDVLPALAGYVNTRKKLLKAGIELYELRPDSNMEAGLVGVGEQIANALHAKSLVFDRKSVFIGSFNLDPRSTALNTEIGVMIDSPEIAGQVGELMDEGVAPGAPFTSRSTRTIIWCGPLRITREKWSTTQIRKQISCTGFMVDLIGMLPIEDQL